MGVNAVIVANGILSAAWDDWSFSWLTDSALALCVCVCVCVCVCACVRACAHVHVCACLLCIRCMLHRYAHTTYR